MAKFAPTDALGVRRVGSEFGIEIFRRCAAAPVREQGIRPKGNDRWRPSRDARVRQEGAEINARQVNDNGLQPGAGRPGLASRWPWEVAA